MIVNGYEIVVEIDGVKSLINLDDTHPSRTGAVQLSSP